MSGHPSFIPKGGGHGRGPGGHGHGPGGHGPAARMMGGEKALAFGPTMRRMLSFMGQFKGRLLLVLLFAVASTAFSIVGPKVLSEATTVLFDGAVASAAGTGSIDFDAIGRILLATLALYLLSAACSWVQSWVMSYISQQTCYRLRDAIAKKIDRVPFGYFEKTSTGDTLSRITNDVDTLGQSLNQGITQAITSAVTVVGVLVMMLSINWIMTLVALVMVPVSMALVAVVVRLSQKHFVAQQRLLGALNGRVEETFSGHGNPRQIRGLYRAPDARCGAVPQAAEPPAATRSGLQRGGLAATGGTPETERRQAAEFRSGGPYFGRFTGGYHGADDLHRDP